MNEQSFIFMDTIARLCHPAQLLKNHKVFMRRSLTRSNQHFQKAIKKLPLGVTSNFRYWGADQTIYVDHAKGFLGRYSPTNGQFKEWEMPSGSSSRPYAMAVDDRDRLWMVETGVTPNRFVGFEPASGEFFAATEIESGGGSVRHMYYDRRTQSIWFGTDTNYLGRAQLP